MKDLGQQDLSSSFWTSDPFYSSFLEGRDSWWCELLMFRMVFLLKWRDVCSIGIVDAYPS